MKSRDISNNLILSNLQQERLLFTTFYADEREADAYHKIIPMTEEIFESSINKFITNNLNDLLLDYLAQYEDLRSEIVDGIEEHVKDTKIPPVAKEGLDRWFIQFKENGYR